MENNQTTITLPVTPKNIKKTFGGSLYLIAAILITFLLGICTLVELINYSIISHQYDIFMGTLVWLAFLLLRIVPNVLVCVSVWMIFISASSHNRFSKVGCKLMQITLICKICIAVLALICGIVIVLANNPVYTDVLYFDNFAYNKLYAVILSIIFIVILFGLQIVLYTFGLRTVSSITKKDSKIKFVKTTPILCIIWGVLLILNLFLINRFANFFNDAFDYTFSGLIAPIILNSCIPFVNGICLLLWGICGLQYAKAISNTRKED